MRALQDMGGDLNMHFFFTYQYGPHLIVKTELDLLMLGYLRVLYCYMLNHRNKNKNIF